MTNLVIDPLKVSLVRGSDEVLNTGPFAEVALGGQYFRLNKTSSKFEKGNATTVTELGRVGGIVLNSVPTVNLTGSIVLVGSNAIVDLGDALDALDYDDPVYVSDTDGGLADSPGTEEKIIGRVVPGYNSTTPDKLLQLIDDPIAVVVEGP